MIALLGITNDHVVSAPLSEPMMEELERLNNLLDAFKKFTSKGEYDEFKNLIGNGLLTGNDKLD